MKNNLEKSKIRKSIIQKQKGTIFLRKPLTRKTLKMSPTLVIKVSSGRLFQTQMLGKWETWTLIAPSRTWLQRWDYKKINLLIKYLHSERRLSLPTLLLSPKNKMRSKRNQKLVPWNTAEKIAIMLWNRRKPSLSHSISSQKKLYP